MSWFLISACGRISAHLYPCRCKNQYLTLIIIACSGTKNHLAVVIVMKIVVSPTILWNIVTFHVTSVSITVMWGNIIHIHNMMVCVMVRNKKARDFFSFWRVVVIGHHDCNCSSVMQEGGGLWCVEGWPGCLREKLWWNQYEKIGTRQKEKEGFSDWL